MTNPIRPTTDRERRKLAKRLQPQLHNPHRITTIDDIKQECQRAIALADKAMAGPWRRAEYRNDDCMYIVRGTDTLIAKMPRVEDLEEVVYDADHIAHSRTFTPAAARALLAAIEAHQSLAESSDYAMQRLGQYALAKIVEAWSDE